ncbi:bis-aminopropyl spermidine synthase family protein [Methanocaldococcus indicus]|uniref:bis-aminopropyl spermidine synthase family protein n=1 Tax=Methanocaldococcus indicus TaxID=213231 RepID=UPI003C6D7863
MENILEKVKKRIDIPVYKRSIENVLSAILANGDFWNIVALSEEPLPLVAEIIKVLEEEGLVKIENNTIKLTEKGLELTKKYGISKREELVCGCCEGRGVSIKQFSDILEKFKEITKDRPLPKHEYDQGFVTPECTIARVALMHSRGDLFNKEVLVLGDDDLTSIALMLTNLPKRIVAVDIDERLMNFIKETAEKLNYKNIEVITLDLRKPLPESYAKKFDTFITDPPETVYAIRTFIGRGISSLKGERCAGYFGITRRESSLDKWREIQKILLNEFNVVITDLIKDFNHYINWGYEEETRAWKLSPVKKKPEKIWYKSYMFRIETLKDSKGFEEEVNIGDELYNDSESSTT